jgi:hypothetical protein
LTLNHQVFDRAPLPIKKIYILEKDQKTKISDLKPQEALIELIRHTYCNKLFQNYERSKNLIQCVNLMKNVDIKSLKINRSLEKLNELVELVEDDICNDMGLNKKEMIK